MKWSPYPFVRFCSVFIIGILFGIYSTVNPHYYWVGLFISFLAYFILSFIVSTKKFKYSLAYAGLSGLMILFFSGCLVINLHHPPKEKLTSTQLNDHQFFTGTIKNNSLTNKKNTKLEIGVHQLYSNKKWIRVATTMILYTDTIMNFEYGDQVIVESKLQEIKNKGNPGEFDFQSYMYDNGIYYTSFLRSRNILKIGEKIPSNIQYYSKKAQNYLSKTLDIYLISPNEKSVIKALSIGKKDEINKPTKDAFSSTGAAHILAVSGLHVGMLFLIIQFFINLIKATKFKNYISLPISLLTIWSFAFITGLSPSVVRAATMFSILQIGITTNRQTLIYNTLAFSAFIQLFINPQDLFHPGFQLSYTAVLSIVYFHPKLYHLIHSNYYIIDKIWSLTCVSIAAQIGTLPLIIYYFGQIPLLSIIVNLIAIPTAFCLLLLSLLLFISSGWVFVAKWIGFILESITTVFLEFIVFFDTLPFNALKRIHFDLMETTILYAIGITCIFFLELKKIRYMILISFFTVSLSSLQIHRRIKNNTHKMIVLHVPSKTSLLQIQNNFYSHYGDELSKEDSLYILEPILKKYSLNKNKLLNGVRYNDNLIYTIGNKKVLYVKNSFTQPLEGINILILSKSSLPLLKENNISKMEKIILDSSVNDYHLIQYQSLLTTLPIHQVSILGAFIIE